MDSIYSEQSLLQKVAALLEVAEDLDGTDLAAVYAAKAQAFVQQYNLDINKARKADTKVTYGVMVKKLAQKAGWCKTLMHVLSKAHFCKSVHTIGRPRTTVVGQKHNLEVVFYLYDYCYRELMRLSLQAYQEEGLEDTCTLDVYRRTFCYGAIAAINQRLEAQTQAFAEAEESRALVVVADAELSAAVERAFPKRTHSRSTRLADVGNAYALGEDAGANLPLHAGVGGAGQHPALPAPK